MTAPSSSGPSPFATGLACRCPRCGAGKLFAGFLTVRPTCETCGLDFSRHDSGDGPAVLIIFVLGFLIVVAALLVEAKYEPPMWVHLVLWPPLILGGAMGMLRPLKGVMIALAYRRRRAEFNGEAPL